MQNNEDLLLNQDEPIPDQESNTENISENDQQSNSSAYQIDTLIVNELITSTEQSSEISTEQSTEVLEGGPSGSLENDVIHKDLQLIIFIFLFFVIYYILRSVRSNFTRIGL